MSRTDNRKTLSTAADIERRLDHSSKNTWAGVAISVLALCSVALVLQQDLPVTSKSSGVLWPADGVSRLYAPRGGTVERVRVQSGDLVKAREPLLIVRHRLIPTEEVKAMQRREQMLLQRIADVQSAISSQGVDAFSSRGLAMVRLEDELSASLVRLRDRLSALREESATVIYASRSGRVVEMRAVPGADVSPDHALVTITAAAPEYRARAYISADFARRLKMGADAQIYLGERLYGAKQFTGKVVGISALPVSPRDVDRSVVIREPLYEVDVSLDPDAMAAVMKAGFSAGAPIGVGFTFDQRTLGAWMLSRFSDS